MIDSSTPGGATGTGGTTASQGGSPSPSPSTGSPTPSSSGTSSAPSTQGSGQQPQPAPQDRNPVPWDRFEEVNSKYGKVSWAEQYEDPEEVSQATQLYRWFDRDPHGAYQYLTGLMERQGYVQRPSAQPPAAPRDPLTEANGRPLPDRIIQETGEQFYSASQAQKLVEWGMQQVGSRVEKLEALTGGIQARTQAQQEAQRIIGEASKWDHFEEYAGEIWEAMERDKRLSIEGAYRRVVVPKIRSKEREAVVAEMRTRADSSTSNPGAGSPASTVDTRKMSMKDLFRREMVRRGMGR